MRPPFAGLIALSLRKKRIFDSVLSGGQTDHSESDCNHRRWLKTLMSKPKKSHRVSFRLLFSGEAFGGDESM